MLQLVYSQITFTTFIRYIGGFKHTLQSSSSLVVLCAHARGSVAFVRVSAGAAGREGCGSASRWFGLSAPAPLRPVGEAYRALLALKGQCRQVVVLGVLLLLVRDVVLSVRPDVRA